MKILRILNTKKMKKKRFEYLSHINESILDNNIFERIKYPHKIILLLYFINENEDKEVYDFYSNLVNIDENNKNNSISYKICNKNVELKIKYYQDNMIKANYIIMII